MCSLRASQQGLEIIEQARKRRGWKRQSLAWADAAFTSIPTLRRFLQGEPIREEIFKGICKAVEVDWKEIIDSSTASISPLSLLVTRLDWGEAPDVSVFYGRNEELATLQQWIVQERCRVVALLGMGGIGKTALAVRGAEQIQDDFQYVIWRSLRHAPPIESFLANLISFFSHQQEQEANLSQLVNFFCQHRCLVVLDGLDVILGSGNPVGHYCQGYEGYGELLRQVAEERDLQSCIMLTSREIPREIVLLEGNGLHVRSLSLRSLGAAANEILREKELTYDAEEGQKLIQMYRGNPLALKIVAMTIKDLFGGSVAEFLIQNTILLHDIFQEILDQQFNRLSELEKSMMYVLAIHPEPISLLQLVENISLKVSRSEIIEALHSLKRRSLIEKSTTEVLFTLQPMVMRYVKRIYRVSKHLPLSQS